MRKRREKGRRKEEERNNLVAIKKMRRELVNVSSEMVIMNWILYRKRMKDITEGLLCCVTNGSVCVRMVIMLCSEAMQKCRCGIVCCFGLMFMTVEGMELVGMCVCCSCFVLH